MQNFLLKAATGKGREARILFFDNTVLFLFPLSNSLEVEQAISEKNTKARQT
jgi:hypothetical protein